MELGRFNAESSSPFPEGDDGKEAPKKKKKHRGGKTPDTGYDAGRPKEREAEKPKRPAPDSLVPLLDRITSELKPDERKTETDKKPEEKVEEHKEPRDTSEADKEKHKEDENTDPEKLSPEERREAAEVYLDEREQRVAREREEAAPETADAQVTEAVDAFLARTREKLTAAPEADVDEATDESFEEIAQEYAPDAHPEVVVTEEPTANPERPAGEHLQPAPEVVPDTGTEAAVGEIPILSADESDAKNPLTYEDIAPREYHANQLPGEDEPGMAAPYELPVVEDTEEHELPVEPVAYAYNFQPPQAQQYNRPPVSPVAVAGIEAASQAEQAVVPIAVPIIVGFAAYLFGKRRGRIKAEQRLMPIQKELEREVRAIHEKLATKETELRQLVRKQAEISIAAGQPFPRQRQELAAVGVAAGAAVARERVVPVQARHEAPPDRLPKTAEAIPRVAVLGIRTPEQIAAMPLTDVPEQEPPFIPRHTIEAAPAAVRSTETARRLSEAMDKAPFEMSGAAAVPSAKYERPPLNMYEVPEVSPLPEVTPSKQEVPVSAMTREEVAKAADEIVVGAATVRQVFETNLISERGMRRVVAEAKRGGDVHRVLAEEMMIKETGYERDPRLRDQPVQHSPVAASVQPPASPTNPYLQQTSEEPMLPAPQSAAQPPLPARTGRRGMSPVTQSALVAANVVALIILGILLLVLLVMHL